MEKIASRAFIARTFSNTLGNQGVPVVEEILENFTNYIVSIECKGELVEVPLDLRNLMKKTGTGLINSLKEKGIQYVVEEYYLELEITWHLNGVEHSVGVTNDGIANDKIFSREFMYYDPIRKIRVWYEQDYLNRFRTDEVQLDGQRVFTTLKTQCRRFFGPLPPRAKK